MRDALACVVPTMLLVAAALLAWVAYQNAALACDTCGRGGLPVLAVVGAGWFGVLAGLGLCVRRFPSQWMAAAGLGAAVFAGVWLSLLKGPVCWYCVAGHALHVLGWLGWLLVDRLRVSGRSVPWRVGLGVGLGLAGGLASLVMAAHLLGVDQARRTRAARPPYVIGPMQSLSPLDRPPAAGLGSGVPATRPARPAQPVRRDPAALPAPAGSADPAADGPDSVNRPGQLEHVFGDQQQQNEQDAGQ